MNKSVKVVSAAIFGTLIAAVPVTLTFAQSAPTATASVNLRTGLNQLLGEHAMILEMRMQALASGNTAQYQALTQVMNTDTQELTSAVAGIYGQPAGQAFEKLWNEHMYFFTYVNDYDAAKSAQQSLSLYKNKFATFMSTANPKLSESTLSTVLQDHINQITTAYNEFEGGHYNESWAELVKDYNLLYTAGGYLAQGIDAQFPSKFNNTSTTTPAVNLQVTLDNLLGEHAIVLEEAMQAEYSGNTPLYNALMKVMATNTSELAAAVSSVYGAQAGVDFTNLWDKHSYFFTYVQDVKDGNTQGAAASQAALTQYKNEFAAFFAQANPHFSESTLSTVLQEHITQITTSFNDYVAGNYSASENELTAAYNLMYTAGGYLAAGIVAQFPSKFDNTVTNTPAGNLRVALDQLLGQHAMVLELRMQALASGNTSLYNALTAVMNQNTTELTAAITGIYGKAGGGEFESLWNEHSYFFKYVNAEVGAQAAQSKLTYYKNEFADFMAKADPQLSAATLSTVLQDHINQITTSFDEYEQGDYAQADQELVKDYNLMFTAGDYLGTGIAAQFPSKFTSSPNTPAGNLQASLDQLLGEHAFILEMRMQALSSHQTAQYNALTAVMAQNTQELTSAIAGIYGPAAGQEFLKLWDEHMYFFTYEQDTLAGNTAGAQAAQNKLTYYKNEFSQFLAGANPNFSEATLSTVLQDHINQISTSWMEYNQKNYTGSYTELVTAYNLMFTAGHYLATGITAQFPSKFGAAAPAPAPTPAPAPSAAPVVLPIIPSQDVNMNTQALQQAVIDNVTIYFRANQTGVYSESTTAADVYNPANPPS